MKKEEHSISGTEPERRKKIHTKYYKEGKVVFLLHVWIYLFYFVRCRSPSLGYSDWKNRFIAQPSVSSCMNLRKELPRVSVYSCLQSVLSVF